MKMMRKILLGFSLFLMVLNVSAVSRKQPGLLPSPQTIEWAQKTVSLNSVSVKNQTGKKTNKIKFTLKTLKNILKQNKLKSVKSGGYKIVLKLDEVDAPYQKEEAYKLSVQKNGMTLTANTEKGLFYGVQTIRQLIVRQQGKTTAALCEITDYPAFGIRGYMHDVGRNFQSIDILKKQIDVMAMYKYSVFHWHLTDHHGWRLESKKHPGLQSEKAFMRNHGKFYTQEEFKDFVKYCRMRNIMVIPEFDSPGHSEAFRHGLGIKNMKEPKALQYMVELIDSNHRLMTALMPFFLI